MAHQRSAEIRQLFEAVAGAEADPDPDPVGDPKPISMGRAVPDVVVPVGLTHRKAPLERLGESLKASGTPERGMDCQRRPSA